MDRSVGGWFAHVAHDTPPGTPYSFRPDGKRWLPDPASRFQPRGVHGASEVVDPGAYWWRDAGWEGRPWEETVLYELHVGAFTREGTFAAASDRLEYLADLGVTAVELLPVAAFPGQRNWGYDGVLPFAPAAAYGRPESLKAFVDRAHELGLMVLLDVVVNHLGPEGNYLPIYAPQFLRRDQDTPWGPAPNLDGRESGPVRDFFRHNALYWLEEFHLDGLRLDAVDKLRDRSEIHWLQELATAVRLGPGKRRHIHLVLENDANEAHWLERDEEGRARWFTAQWNDDLHHALQATLTGDRAGYYVDFAVRRAEHLACALAEGFAYQGEPSVYRGGRPRGEPSKRLPPMSFVAFLQNHDQIGNRPGGRRITTLAEPHAVRAAAALVLLAPQIPLLFMGEEIGARQPFFFFCDHEPSLTALIGRQRRRDLGETWSLDAATAQRMIPDPGDPRVFERCVVDPTRALTTDGAGWLAVYRELLWLRWRHLVPRLAGTSTGSRWCREDGGAVLAVSWMLGDSSEWFLLANLQPRIATGIDRPPGALIYASPPELEVELQNGRLPGWAVACYHQSGAA
jgi:malto-oligosyltrehalose trehalohydrolase